MAAPVYATEADVAAFYAPGDAPSGIGAPQLRAASRIVDRMLLTAVYSVDDSGVARRSADREAITEATILQAAHTVEHGTGAEIAADSVPVKLGPLSIGGGGGSDSGGGGVSAFSSEAWHALRGAGLIMGAAQ